MPLKVDRLDPSIGDIIPADAKLERIATGFTWTEGPVWAGDSLYFADIPANIIHKWTPGCRSHDSSCIPVATRSPLLTAARSPDQTE